MPAKTIYCGRFISAPYPGPNSALEIKEGAVLVSYPQPPPSQSQGVSDGSFSTPQPAEGTAPPTGSGGSYHDGGAKGARGNSRRGHFPGEGIIEMVDWTVSSPEEARERFGLGADEAEAVSCRRQGFFFPGFVGE